MNVLQKIGGFLGEKLSEVYTMLKAHVSDRWNPHQVTKEQVGLGNVDNTSDLDKPVSTAQQDALNGKVNREEGKELMPSPDEGLNREYYLNASGKWEKISPDAMVITMTIQEDGQHFSLDEDELGAYLKAYYGISSYEEERNPDTVNSHIGVYLKYAPYGVRYKEDGTVDNIFTIWNFIKVILTSTEYGIPHLIAREFDADDEGVVITGYYCQIDIWNDNGGALKPSVMYSSISKSHVAFKSYVDNTKAGKADFQAHIDKSSIHRTSAEIRAEITEGDIPPEIARQTTVEQALNEKVDREEGKELVASVEIGKLANIGTYLSESTGFRAEENGSWSIGFRSMNPVDHSSAVHDFVLPVVSADRSGLMPPEYKQAIESLGSGVIIIPADFTKGSEAMEAGMIAAAQERLADGTLFKKPVYLLYRWKEDYTNEDAPVYYSLVSRSDETWTTFGAGKMVSLLFNSSIVVAFADEPEYAEAMCLVIKITTSNNQVRIAYQSYSDPYMLENIYLTEDENGIINNADKNWNKLYTELKKNNHPQVSLKTPSSGMYCPVSYEFTVNDAAAANPVYSGTMEISYVKETDGVQELWVETRVIPDFWVTGSYNFDSYLKKYPLSDVMRVSRIRVVNTLPADEDLQEGDIIILKEA